MISDNVVKSFFINQVGMAENFFLTLIILIKAFLKKP